ncbi:MAG: flagellar export protein FliJ [Lachnospiraceae bacterium]
MARFVYRMQNILEIKRKLEDQAKMEYGLARARLNEEEEKLEQLRLRKAGYEEQSRQLLKEKLKLREVREAKEATLRMDEFIERQKEEIRKAEQALEEERIKLQKAIQERKIHEKLRENAYEEYLLEEKAAENREIDELTSYTYGQKKAED